MIVVATYLAFANLLAFWLFGHDKRAAERGARRISEDSLLFISAIGGSPGALAAQQLFRHKTRKQPFQTLFRVVMGLQAAGIVAAFAFWDRIAALF